ncbi:MULTISPECIES: AEC family transporter [Rhodococcus]|uniref:AEC family transporter n=3 Tax=Rhodococcus erythropolis TaxID=1833 RepID=A0AAP4RT15_RHOER|nr:MULTISPECIES: AEC family transporter [Rhodococcus]ERB51264.1 membrane protein [Rhodococcus sp. P27]MCD2153307.1 AEC family transporter [Rhodococcus cerastii]NRH33734.1 AEC family transporter [Rhodococcus sp. MS13]AGT93962.1 AEC family transporter [Rhodococcus erythropolis CCM2595]MBF7732358.1 AEC family transporter [Rhodococcus erythropolis]
MSGVVAGFTVIFVVIAVGYLLGRLGTLGSQGQFVLGRLVFFVATPALLFTTLASSDLSVIFSPTLAVASATAFAVGALYVVVAKIWLNRPLPELTIGALSASYVNSANLGIPIAVFVLGDATFVAPLLLFQIVVYSPIALTILDLTALRGEAEKLSLIDTVTAPFKNPIVLAGAAGLIVALIGWVPPRPLMQPFELIGATSVPGALLAFGLSLYGVRVLEKGSSPRRDVALASTLKIVVQPVLAYLMAHFLLGIDGHQLFAIVVVSTLPTAQNVFIYASRYRRGMVLARDSAFVTTLASIPAIALVTALLA